MKNCVKSLLHFDNNITLYNTKLIYILKVIEIYFYVTKLMIESVTYV